MAQTRTLPRLLVCPFAGDSSEIVGWQPEVGSQLSIMAAIGLARDGRMDILISTNGTQNDSPDLILLGTVTRFGVDVRSTGPNTPRTSFTESQRSNGKCSVRIAWH